jgi:hypothetical protein
MRYWAAFPRGVHVDEALAAARRRLDSGAKYCIFVSSGYLQEDREGIRTSVVAIRASLDAVAAAGKPVLLTLLAEIEQACVAGAVSDLDDPSAIPGLTRALGSGFTMVSRRLGAFGDAAAPAVLAALGRPGLDAGAVDDALDALRFMVEGANASPLSTGTVESVRGVAERWLMERPQSILTLAAAIDLAIALGDPALRRIVEFLASDPTEVVARGITAGASIEIVQKRAVDRLRETSAIPRP